MQMNIQLPLYMQWNIHSQVPPEIVLHFDYISKESKVAFLIYLYYANE